MSTNSNESFPRRVQGSRRQQNTRVSSWLRIKACNRLAWATRTGLPALARLRLWRVAMVNARVAEIEICSESVDFDDCLVGFFIIQYRLQCLIVAAVISHS